MIGGYSAKQRANSRSQRCDFALSSVIQDIVLLTQRDVIALVDPTEGECALYIDPQPQSIYYVAISSSPQVHRQRHRSFVIYTRIAPLAQLRFGRSP